MQIIRILALVLALAGISRAALPTMGEMLRDQVGDAGPAETQAEMLARYAADL